jgi:hypothetical protein
MRISTTVDADRLRRARSLAGLADSDLFDQALVLFLSAVEGERERAILREQPYHDDPELQLPEPDVDADLPYDGEVPDEVLRLAAERRAARR